MKTEGEVLALVRGYALAERWRIDSHGRVRMRERGASYEDVKHGLVTGTRCRAQPNGRWRLETRDLDDEDLTIILLIDDGVLVVTLF